MLIAQINHLWAHFVACCLLEEQIWKVKPWSGGTHERKFELHFNYFFIAKITHSGETFSCSELCWQNILCWHGTKSYTLTFMTFILRSLNCVPLNPVSWIVPLRSIYTHMLQQSICLPLLTSDSFCFAPLLCQQSYCCASLWWGVVELKEPNFPIFQLSWRRNNAILHQFLKSRNSFNSVDTWLLKTWISRCFPSDFLYWWDISTF